MMSQDKLKSMQELGEIYHQVKRNTILGFHLHGLSYREISKRIGGSTPPVVKKILDELKEDLQEDIRKEQTQNES